MSENAIKKYFAMWVDRDFSELDRIFSEDIYYRECYGATYFGLNEIHSWINDLLSKQTVLEWKIKKIYNISNSTFFVEWFFRAKEKDVYLFDGISTIKFRNNKIVSIEEYETKHDTFRPFKTEK
ncbi:nuclear transport factor 2 family protein [Leuconostoc mesenteroides]